MVAGHRSPDNPHPEPAFGLRQRRDREEASEAAHEQGSARLKTAALVGPGRAGRAVALSRDAVA